MSTTSSIWIKVKPEDFGKTISFNKEIHPLGLDEFNVAPPTFKIKEKHNLVLYLGVYCHNDGYPSGVGATLLKHFDTYEKVLNLVSLGDLSALWNSTRAYYSWRQEKWDGVKPMSIENFPTRGDMGTDYCYIFDGVWKVGKDVELADFLRVK